VSLRLVYFAVFRVSGWLAMLAGSGLTAQTSGPGSTAGLAGAPGRRHLPAPAKVILARQVTPWRS